MMHYFAEDGSYGTAECHRVFDTSEWTKEDWQKIEDCQEKNRLSIAVEINDKRLPQDHPLRVLA
jgi:hypothetical protein